MKMTGVGELAHKMEDVLDAARGGKLTLTSSVTDILLTGVDALVAMLEKVKAGDHQTAAPSDVCEALSQATQASPMAKTAVIQTDAAFQVHAVQVPADDVFEQETFSPNSKLSNEPSRTKPAEPTATAPAPVHRADYLRVNADKLDDLIHLMGEIVSEHGRYRRQLRRLGEFERQTARHLLTVNKQLQTHEPSGQILIDTGSTLQHALHQMVLTMTDDFQMRDHLVADLQETSLRMRMQPLSTVFDPLRRTVRDLAHEYGKEIDFEVEGGETELDRKIIDRIGDSLLHLIRNSLDHGLENAAERLAANKPAKGRITLSAFYDSGCVMISLGDDGQGISVDKIRDKAQAKRLVKPDVLAGMSRAEIIDLIFLPGLSTSAIITDLSGRGVGMDVVRKNMVDELKGTIVIETTQGVGTTFFFRLPLHLAVFSLFLFSTRDK